MPDFSINGLKVWVAGHSGLVGSALVRRLSREAAEILTVSHDDLDLTRQAETESWIEANRPDVIILSAAKVGGIGGNSAYPADFLAQNLAIAQNVIDAAARFKTQKLLFLGSSCIYPKFAEQPIRPESLLTGALEVTNEAYALAKIAGIKLCQFYRQQYGHDFISIMPCNLYGIGDRWGDHGGHVIPNLIEKMHRAKMLEAESVTLWGTGTPYREFLYSDDLADALVLALQCYSSPVPLNVGSGEEVMILDLADIIRDIVGFRGQIIWDRSKPDGAPRKIIDSAIMREMGWKPLISLKKGISSAYQDFIKYENSLRR